MMIPTLVIGKPDLAATITDDLTAGKRALTFVATKDGSPIKPNTRPSETKPVLSITFVSKEAAIMYMHAVQEFIDNYEG